MTRFRHNDDLSRLEEQLRRQRPQPSRELEDLLTTYTAYQPRESGLRARIGLAAALSGAMVIALGALVGVGKAASGPQQVVTAVVKVITSSSSSSSSSGGAGGSGSGNGGGTSSGGGGGTTSGGGQQGGGSGGNNQDPSNDQYGQGNGCGDKNHVQSSENKCKKGNG
jgi:hypothetical protein